jgi:hypothetical protein
MLSTVPAFPSVKDHGLADKLSLGLLELAEDRGRTDLRSWHGDPVSEFERVGVCI